MADTGGPDATGIVETRWRKYGKDRIYLRTIAGDDVGYVDLVTKQAVVTDAGYDAAVRACLERSCSTATEPPPAPAAPAPAAVAEEPWTAPATAPIAGLAPPTAIDLAGNVAGAAARAKREEVNAQAPVRNLLARVLGVKTDERSWRVGAKGEEKVGRELESLGPEWQVLHAIPVGQEGSDIDHVVIGPAGVYTLNAKCHPNGKAWIGERAILVNGQRTNYLRNSRFEARRAGTLLSTGLGRPVAVEPVIVFVDLVDFTVKQQPADVHVTTRRRLVRWFRSRPSVLSLADVAAIHDVARLTTTWHRRDGH